MCGDPQVIDPCWRFRIISWSRQRLHAILDELHRRASEQPRVLVNQELESLPPGVHLSPGRIQIDDFRTADEAKQKLLALILAMGNDPDGFDGRITVPE